METYATKIRDRHHAGILLAEKLKFYPQKNTIVAAISKGGVIVAQPISATLCMPLKVIPCKRITHPSNECKTIGAVCPNNVTVYSHAHDLPQDYIEHHVHILQNELRKEMQYYSENSESVPIEGKNVILVDDLMITGNTMMASLVELRKRNPCSIIVAAPFISAEAHFFLEEFADEIVYLRMETHVISPLDFYEIFTTVDQFEVKQLIKNSR